MKKILIAFIAIIFIPISTSLTLYNITIKDQKVYINVTFNLTADKSYDIWRVTWEIPQQYEIISITDEIGQISYTKRQGEIYFETNKLNSKERIVNIQYFLLDALSNEYEPLKKMQLYLTGFPNDKTIVNIYLPGLISGDSSYGFTEYFGDNYAQFSGRGAVDIILFYSYSGREYENYLLFGLGDLTVADNMFSLIKNITGVSKPYKRFPVVVLKDSIFESKVQPWGTASHTRGGLILIKQSVANSPYNASVILHETTHGVNAKILKWNQVNATWFEEGISSFIEYLSNQKLGLEQGELFGQNKIIKQGSEKIVIKSKGNKEDLWDYYKQGKDFMYYWNPIDNSKRDFGYAFSELVIRYSVKKNGIEKIKETYKKLEKFNETVTDPIKSTNIILSALDANFMPCYSVDRNLFDACLKDINEQKFIVPNVNFEDEKPIQIINETFDISKSVVIQNEEQKIEKKSFFEEIIEKVKEILKNLFNPTD